MCVSYGDEEREGDLVYFKVVQANRVPPKLIDAVKSLIIPFIHAADQEAPHKATGQSSLDAKGRANNVLVDSHTPESLLNHLRFSLPTDEGLGKDGLLQTIQQVLKYSVNTWDQGFLDKLYASTNAVRPWKSRSSEPWYMN